MSIMAYPLLGTLVAFTSLPSLAASVPVRASVLVLSLLLISRLNESALRPAPYRVIILFWLLYLLRLLWDLFVAQVPVAGEFLFNFLFFSVLPTLGLMHAQQLDERRLASLLLRMGCATCIVAVLANYSDLASARSYTEIAEGRLFLETVNPITFGHAGVTTLLAAFVLVRLRPAWSTWLFVTAGAALGLVTIQMAASRGPLISLFVCIVALGLVKRRYRWMLLPVFAAAAAVLGGLVGESDSLLVSRVAGSTLTENAEVRIVLQANAIQQFLDGPLLGSAIVEREFQDYPHNPLIEAAMAMGVLGLGLFLVISWNILAGILRHLRSGSMLVPLLALQAFSAAQFSGALASSSVMWMLMAVVVLPPARQRRSANAVHLSTSSASAR